MSDEQNPEQQPPKVGGETTPDPGIGFGSAFGTEGGPGEGGGDPAGPGLGCDNTDMQGGGLVF